MAPNEPTDIERLSPEKLLARFNRSGIVVCLIAAFALHVIVLGATSVEYIHGLIDPVWKAEQDRLAEQARKRADAARQARAAPAPARPTAASRPASRPAAPKAPDRPKPAPRREVPEELRRLPAPGELPAAPSGGIGIDETEGK